MFFPTGGGGALKSGRSRHRNGQGVSAGLWTSTLEITANPPLQKAANPAPV